MTGSLACLLLLAASAPVTGIDGDWLTANGSAIVRIGPCGDQICGRIVRVLARGANVPRSDVHNPDPSLRARPLVGLPVLTGFAKDGSGGHAYDAKTGKSYKARLARNPDGSLTVTGCILFLCKSQRWTRLP